MSGVHYTMLIIKYNNNTITIRATSNNDMNGSLLFLLYIYFGQCFIMPFFCLFNNNDYMPLIHKLFQYIFKLNIVYWLKNVLQIKTRILYLMFKFLDMLNTYSENPVTTYLILSFQSLWTVGYLGSDLLSDWLPLTPPSMPQLHGLCSVTWTLQIPLSKTRTRINRLIKGLI